MSSRRLLDLAPAHHFATPLGITSVCSAHPLVIEATLIDGRERGDDVLIEATCNQVNQFGGYTGMRPADFRRFVEDIADRVGFDRSRLILGGDHLGPNPWKGEPAEAAMAKALDMVSAFVAAGFTKLHLDCSMGCQGEPSALSDHETAARAARLAERAEQVARDNGLEPPVYVIGTEVPIPGGAMEVVDHLTVTSPEAAIQTVEIHRQAFRLLGLDDAFGRAIGIVVQPGVEFGNENVVVYDRPSAAALSASLGLLPGFVFEAHSTDYQPRKALTQLVADGFAILKVGPGVTFALREAYYALDHILAHIEGEARSDGLIATVERVLVEEPQYWQSYYHGSATEKRIQRHFSYSDRIRYYWPHPVITAAVERLMARLGDQPLPSPLISQYLGALMPLIESGRVKPVARDLLIGAVRRVLDDYSAACRAN